MDKRTRIGKVPARRTLARYPEEDLTTLDGYSRSAGLPRFDAYQFRDFPEFPKLRLRGQSQSYLYYSISELDEFFRSPPPAKLMSRTEAKDIMHDFVSSIRSVPSTWK